MAMRGMSARKISGWCRPFPAEDQGDQGDGREDRNRLLQEETDDQESRAKDDGQPSPLLLAVSHQEQGDSCEQQSRYVGAVLRKKLAGAMVAPRIIAHAIARYQPERLPRMVTASRVTRRSADANVNTRPEKLFGPTHRKISPWTHGTNAPYMCVE